MSIYQQKKYALSLKMLNWLLWVRNFSVVFLPVMLSWSQTIEAYAWFDFILFESTNAGIFFLHHATIGRISTISTFHFQYFALSCCFVSSVYMKLPLTSTLPIFCHPNIKVLSSSQHPQGHGLLGILMLTHYNSIPFFPNVLLSEASYTL